MIAILRDEEGNTLVEYALVLSLLSLAFIAGARVIGAAASTALTSVETGLTLFETNGP